MSINKDIIDMQIIILEMKKKTIEYQLQIIQRQKQIKTEWAIVKERGRKYLEAKRKKND